MSESASLTDDQRTACDRLLAIAGVRSNATEAALSTDLIARWSTPLLVGPAGSGKEFVCREVARRLGNVPYRRWELGSWITVANRATHTTPEQIESFIAAHPAGCVVYLAGADTLTTAFDRSHGYYQAQMGEIESLLGWSSARPPKMVGRDGTVLRANVLMVVGGRFSALWGERSTGGPAGAESWKLADREPLASVGDVAQWLEEHSGLPTSLLRLLTAFPSILRPPSKEEAARIAARLYCHLPPFLDGITTGEISDALQGPRGWNALTDMIEQTLMMCHEGLPDEGTSNHENPIDAVPTPSVVDLSGSVANFPEQPSALLVDPIVPPLAQEPASPVVIAPSELPARAAKLLRLADRLGWPLFRSRLLGKARRLGLPTAGHLEALAIARGYTLSGEELSAQRVFLPEAWKDQFRDTELAISLLSPGLEYAERAIMRGSLMLRRLCTTIETSQITRVVNREHAGPIVRHIATLGLVHGTRLSIYWKKILAILPKESADSPALRPDVMPDIAILVAFADDDGLMQAS